jgi:hypothetical protein
MYTTVKWDNVLLIYSNDRVEDVHIAFESLLDTAEFHSFSKVSLKDMWNIQFLSHCVLKISQQCSKHQIIQIGMLKKFLRWSHTRIWRTVCQLWWRHDMAMIQLLVVLKNPIYKLNAFLITMGIQLYSRATQHMHVNGSLELGRRLSINWNSLGTTNTKTIITMQSRVQRSVL